MRMSRLLLALALAAGSRAAETPAFTADQLLQAWGWGAAYQHKVAELELSDAEAALFLRGADAAFRGRPAAIDTVKAAPEVKRLGRERRERYVRALAERYRAQWQAFLEGRRAALRSLPNGTWYEVLRAGAGPRPRPRQAVRIRYVGRLLDGTEFYQFGPIEEVLDPLRLADYLCAGYQQVPVGGEIRLYVPAPFSDRDADKLGVPPGSTMVFDLELLGVRDPTPQELADALVPLAPDVDDSPPSGYSHDQLVEGWGWTAARGMRIEPVGLSDAELSQLERGLGDAVRGRPPPADFSRIGPAAERYARQRAEAARAAFRDRQLAAGRAFFAGLRRNPRVTFLPSGLAYEVLRPGRGPLPKDGATVKIFYVGHLIDGRQFDLRPREYGPAPAPIGAKADSWLIAGMNEGLHRINAGGLIRLYIPPALGYGDEAFHNVPADSTLIYDVEAVEVDNP
ncbi:MAG TPA: FKBP-type peptidyl-prolyl cis-trans isomerase [Opitutaceae bacterium]|nr:FKBP-type peptidyl-prolyl cis-trans isomerase [Opitutaceae bacterium]